MIKLDRSLVTGCALAAGGRTAVLRALVTYATELGAQVCAEGVEDGDDLRFLISLGVTHAQGYLLGRPAAGWQPVALKPRDLQET